MYSKDIDKKWQQYWEKNKVYKFDKERKDDILYILEMFSYPSGSKLHIGHWFNYAPVDTYARFKKMKGYNVFHPMGFDAFGLPAENFAIKTGVHPKDSTEQNIKNMEIQLKEMGGSFDWDYEIKTCEPEYYKWTQWIFTYLYKKGLAYRKEAPVNWCPSCNTVLANEQVINGECERCGTVVERKKLRQWFFKTTAYAEELLQGLKELNWPNLTKKIQTNWIGKSEGAEIVFKIEESEKQIPVFTTRPDTIYGVTYLAVAPESELAQTLITEEKRTECEEYINKTKTLSELERQFTDREKTGVFTGTYAINPKNNKKIPIYLSDYVLESYGNGAVMGVPGHDTRDFDFAKKYGIEIIQVIADKTGKEVELPYTEKENTVLINSNNLNGLDTKEAMKVIISELRKEKIGDEKTEYKLKDWLVSRQRYWGAPIPIIYCDDCGEVLVPEEDLPVVLPYNVEFKPDGKSPLAKSEEFIHTNCPKCGKPAIREVDTLDTFVCSSWYQLRYPFNKESKVPFKTPEVNKFVPVDVYVGGKEHASMHLIYSRFIYKALRDGGYVSSSEPFKRLIHQGLILGPDGNKMSKSKGNTIAPDDYVDKYGSDVLRMYMMFGMAYEEGGPWNEEAINAMNRYIVRIQNLKERLFNNISDKKISEKDLSQLRYILHTSIKQIETDMERFSFNTSIAKLMEIVNEMIRIENIYGSIEELRETFKVFVKLLAPFAPHLSEEMWNQFGNNTSIHLEEYPEYMEKYTHKDTVAIAVQINGKLREVVELNVDESKEKALDIAKNLDNIKKHIEGKEIVKEIYVPKKIINIVVK